MFHWMVLNVTPNLHPKNSVYLVYSTKMLIFPSRGCLKCIVAAHWARCPVQRAHPRNTQPQLSLPHHYFNITSITTAFKQLL